MGACVAGCMSMKNESSQVENLAIREVREMVAQSVEYGKAASANESAPRHAPETATKSLEELYTEFYGGTHKTIVRQLQLTCKQHAEKKAVAYRLIDRIEKTEIEVDGKKKPWEYIYLKDTQYITYAELWQKMVNFGRGIAAIGYGKDTRVGMYEETRWEWMVACYGLWTQSMVAATVYANLGEDALLYAIKEAELHCMFCNGKAVKNVIRLCNQAGIPVPTLIYNDELPAGLDLGSVKAYSFTDILAKGAEITEGPELPSDPEALALIMYTSGTTGDPKGVIITHGNVYAAVATTNSRVKTYLALDGTDTYVAYLPLAHILEFAVENILLNMGAMLGYGNPRTLTDTSAKPHGDLREYRPTIFVGVPRIYDTIKKAVEAKMPVDGVKRRVFDRAYEERRQALQKGLETPYWNEKAFGTTRALLGGRCRMLISGGAPLSGKSQEFLSIVFGCAVGQGYGLTETCAVCTVQRFYDTTLESIGGPADCVEVKLVDAEEWKHTDNPPRGEICIRGPVVSKGYYKQPEKTKEAFKSDGWFHTGDVGTFQPDGTLRIIGRVKALAKNAHGEYIALESLESTYVLNPLVLPNGVCVLVHPHRSYIAALALTDEAKAMKFAAANKIEGKYPEILQDPAFQRKAAESLAATAKEGGRKPFEHVKMVRILADEWTPENGILTAAMKLKRRVVDERYKDVIAELFANEGSPA